MKIIDQWIEDITKEKSPINQVFIKLDGMYTKLDLTKKSYVIGEIECHVITQLTLIIALSPFRYWNIYHPRWDQKILLILMCVYYLWYRKRPFVMLKVQTNYVERAKPTIKTGVGGVEKVCFQNRPLHWFQKYLPSKSHKLELNLYKL